MLVKDEGAWGVVFKASTFSFQICKFRTKKAQMHIFIAEFLNFREIKSHIYIFREMKIANFSKNLHIQEQKTGIFWSLISKFKIEKLICKTSDKKVTDLTVYKNIYTLCVLRWSIMRWTTEAEWVSVIIFSLNLWIWCLYLNNRLWKDSIWRGSSVEQISLRHAPLVPATLTALIARRKQQTTGFQFCAIMCRDYRGFDFTQTAERLISLFGVICEISCCFLWDERSAFSWVLMVHYFRRLYVVEREIISGKKSSSHMGFPGLNLIKLCVCVCVNVGGIWGGSHSFLTFKSIILIYETCVHVGHRLCYCVCVCVGSLSFLYL